MSHINQLPRFNDQCALIGVMGKADFNGMTSIAMIDGIAYKAAERKMPGYIIINGVVFIRVATHIDQKVLLEKMIRA